MRDRKLDSEVWCWDDWEAEGVWRNWCCISGRESTANWVGAEIQHPGGETDCISTSKPGATSSTTCLAVVFYVIINLNYIQA